jgi:hypothetical protein
MQHSTYPAASSRMWRYHRIMDECKLLEDLHSGWFATEKTEYNISQVQEAASVDCQQWQS